MNNASALITTMQSRAKAIPARHRGVSGRAFIRYLRALAATFAVTLATSSQAEQPVGIDPRATDAVDKFTEFCVATGGTRDKALATFGNGIPGANRLADATLSAAENGQVGGVGWVIRTANEATFLLEYNPIGLCGLRLIEADERSVQIAFGALASASATVAHSPLKTDTPAVREENGAKITLQDYSYAVPGHIAHLTLYTSDHKVGAQQHLMMFAFTKSDK